MTTQINPMGFWKTAFLYGFPAGLLVIGMMVASKTFFGFNSSGPAMALGFLLIFLFLSLLFFGMRKYRNSHGGTLKLSKALLLGLAMSLFAGIAYVIGSEIYLATIGQNFMAEYTDHLVSLQIADGVTGEALQSFKNDMASLLESYKNPGFRIPMTFFMEIFPMALFVAVISAFGLHKPKFWTKNK